jgi:predicted Zn-dependent protease
MKNSLLNSFRSLSFNKSKLLFIFLFFISITGCSTVSQLADIAGDLGVVDKRVAQSVSETSTALGKAVEEITPEQEYYIGRAVAGTILEKYKLYKSPAVEKYLNEICGAITVNSDKPVLYKGYYVAILDTDEVNAFATSGGHILISRGLLSCAESEDALAAVIAHEVSHIQLQHSIKAIKSSRATDALVKTANTAYTLKTDGNSNEVMDGFADSVGDIINTMVESGYSKQQEFDADKKALSLMNDAGYDPNAMKDMLTLLKVRQAGQHAGFSKTHPSPDARLSNLKYEYVNYSSYTDRANRTARFKSAMRSL